ncbi:MULTISPECIES: glutaminyl-peptide cyclotransferase [unclassified Crossiella]|uniref:glutaminyl-peptide cyclotransferase n=1 Tax=unclassified Crossiella TaxID=2620835 RepID=UPI001FFFFF79|nr:MULTISPECIES: glutaminyl-peptide cyclotransferase [unclassified Crossiella]MCK2237968.1 glutaminyl-peptide cyclotransferase [Crossiella sp. S99.2]MCK2255251.1 glutaminyl-peptide cyclotransferase [Crossiella sp. S99.1]
MRVLAVLCGVLAFSGCSAVSQADAPLPQPEKLRVELLETRPHDPGAFTQGLELADGALYEGTGQEGSSSLRRVDPVTGVVQQRADLPADHFGEGITVIGDKIWQLTWQQGLALRWDRQTLTRTGQANYEGEGWGLCHDGNRLVMSNGSDQLTFRDPGSFAVTGTVTVRHAGAAVSKLNELECVNGVVWANVWQTDEILRIDPASGAVTGTVDASGLLRPEQQERADVLNGIAAIPGTDEFLVTGKLWPALFRVKFVPVRQD